MAANQNPNRKSESIRRANRIIQTRSFVLMILMGVVMFVLLVLVLAINCLSGFVAGRLAKK